MCLGDCQLPQNSFDLKPDHGQTSHFEYEIGFFQEVLLKKHAYCLGFD